MIIEVGESRHRFDVNFVFTPEGRSSLILFFEIVTNVDVNLVLAPENLANDLNHGLLDLKLTKIKNILVMILTKTKCSNETLLI